MYVCVCLIYNHRTAPKSNNKDIPRVYTMLQESITLYWVENATIKSKYFFSRRNLIIILGLD